MTRYEYDEVASAEFRMDVVHEIDESSPAPVSRSDLEALGFQGFVPFAHLPAREVPTQEGVYAIVRPTSARPEFVAGWNGRRVVGPDMGVTSHGDLTLGPAPLAANAARHQDGVDASPVC